MVWPFTTAQAENKPSGPELADPEFCHAAFAVAPPTISNLLANVERQINMQLVFFVLPDKYLVAARYLEKGGTDLTTDWHIWTNLVTAQAAGCAFQCRSNCCS